MLKSSNRGYIVMSILLSGMIAIAGFQWMRQEVKIKACDVSVDKCSSLSHCVVVKPCKCLDEFCPVCEVPDSCERK